METTAVPKLLPHLWKSTLLSGILSLTLGILVYVLPEHSIVIAAALFGIYLLVTGAAQVFFAFSLHVTAGGRVLGVTARAADLETAVDRAYQAVARIGFEGAHYRKDIAARALIDVKKGSL